jgi:hypothetical protein
MTMLTASGLQGALPVAQLHPAVEAYKVRCQLPSRQIVTNVSVAWGDCSCYWSFTRTTYDDADCLETCKVRCPVAQQSVAVNSRRRMCAVLL